MIPILKDNTLKHRNLLIVTLFTQESGLLIFINLEQ
jgi:hypothetical protein